MIVFDTVVCTNEDCGEYNIEKDVNPDEIWQRVTTTSKLRVALQLVCDECGYQPHMVSKVDTLA